MNSKGRNGRQMDLPGVTAVSKPAHRPAATPPVAPSSSATANPPFALCRDCHVAQNLHAQGLVEEAEKTCLELWQADPNHHESLLLFAAIRFAADDFETAYKNNLMLGQQHQGALSEAHQSFAQGYAEMAGSLSQEGNLHKAEHAYRNALALNQRLVHVRNDLGNLLKSKGLLPEAKVCYEECLRQEPTMAVAWNNIGCINLEENNLQLAVHHFSKAAYFDPYLECTYKNLLSVLGAEGQTVTLANLGNMLKDEGRLEMAAHVYQKSLATKKTAHAHAGLASVMHRRRQLSDAALHYSEALRLHAGFVECHTNLGHVLRDLGDLNGARASFLNAVALNPNSADDYNNLACICKDLGIIVEAIQYYRAALALRPINPNVYCNLAHSLQMVCDWSDYDGRMEELVRVVNHQIASNIFPSVHPHHTFLYPLGNPLRRSIAAAHANAAKRNAALLQRPAYSFDHLKTLDGRLRIGYVSSDFKDHPTSHLMQSIPGFHDKEKVEIFCYSLAPDDKSVYRRKIASEAEHFVDVSGFVDANGIYDNAMVADRIYADKIHILVNLNGYTKGARTEVFALRPAPIQVMWLGYPGTSGSDFMDYIITDSVTSPPELWQEQYTEFLMYMPNTFFVGDHMQMFPLPPPPPPPAEPEVPVSVAEAVPMSLADTVSQPSSFFETISAPMPMDQTRAPVSHVMEPSAAMALSTPAMCMPQLPVPPTVPMMVASDLTPQPSFPAIPPPHVPGVFPIPYVQTNYIVPGAAAAFPTAIIPNLPLATAAFMPAQMPAPHPALPPMRPYYQTLQHPLMMMQNAQMQLQVAQMQVAQMQIQAQAQKAAQAQAQAALSPLVDLTTGCQAIPPTPPIVTGPTQVRRSHRELGPESQRPAAQTKRSRASTYGSSHRSAGSESMECESGAAGRGPSFGTLSQAPASVPFQVSQQPQQPMLLNPMAMPLASLPSSAVPGLGMMWQSAAPSPAFNQLSSVFSLPPSTTLLQAPATAVEEPAHAPLPCAPDMPRPNCPPLTRAHYKLPEDKVILCNFNQLYKIDPKIFRSWLSILQGAPNAVLWLLRFPPAGEANLRLLAAQAGVDDRIIFSPVASKVEHVRRGSLADICLDTHVCNGHTTGMDILWGGTPMITLPGETLASRVASSQLTALGCPELIATSFQDYIDKGVALATQPDALRQVQEKVRERRRTSPLFNTRLFARNLERGFMMMMINWQRNGTPQHLAVPPSDVPDEELAMAVP